MFHHHCYHHLFYIHRLVLIAWPNTRLLSRIPLPCKKLLPWIFYALVSKPCTQTLLSPLAAREVLTSFNHTIVYTDKTGTLTTAQITVFRDQIISLDPDTISANDVLSYAALASNPNKKVDAHKRLDFDYRNMNWLLSYIACVYTYMFTG